MAWHELADVGTMLALSIRQPYAELILRGIKTVEYRTRATRIIDEEFYIYAARSRAKTRASIAAWIVSPIASGRTEAGNSFARTIS